MSALQAFKKTQRSAIFLKNSLTKLTHFSVKNPLVAWVLFPAFDIKYTVDIIEYKAIIGASVVRGIYVDISH